MQVLNFVLPKLELYAPVAIVLFAVLLVLFAEVSRWLHERQARSSRLVWVAIVALAIALAVLIVLFDWWLAGRLSPAKLSVLTWGTRTLV